jgi:type IV pilus biogenesis protein CpaD/CtpE
MTMKKTLLITALSVVAFGGMLSACAPDKPWLMEQSTVNDSPMQLVESRHITKKPLAALNDEDIAEAARIYNKNGAGPMYMVIAYKDNGKTGTGTIAGKKIEIENNLMGAGVKAADITSSLVPLATDEPVVLIAFDTLEATGPAGCTLAMPGYSTNAEEGNMLAYKTGCGVKSVMARQIANPLDLEGRAGLVGGSDGNRAADVVSGQYRPGATPRSYLPSYLISELAGSGG